MEEVGKFSYMGSEIAVNGETEEDVRTRIGKARTAFNSLNKTGNSKTFHLRPSSQSSPPTLKLLCCMDLKPEIISKLQSFTYLCRDLLAKHNQQPSSVGMHQTRHSKTPEEEAQIKSLRKKD